MIYKIVKFIKITNVINAMTDGYYKIKSVILKFEIVNLKNKIFVILVMMVISWIL